MTDERMGLPSASGIERVIACPGSVALTKDIPKPEPGQAAIEGTIIHSVLEGQKVDATPDQLWVADKLKETADKVVRDFSMMIGSDVRLCQAEMRMVLEDKKKVVAKTTSSGGSAGTVAAGGAAPADAAPDYEAIRKRNEARQREIAELKLKFADLFTQK